MSDPPTKQAATPAEAGAGAPAAPAKVSRGVRWEPDEETWLGSLMARIYAPTPGARPSFAAAVRESMSWGRLLLGEDTGVERLRRLEELRLDLLRNGWGEGLTTRGVATMVIEAGFEALRSRVPHAPTAPDLASPDALKGDEGGA